MRADYATSDLINKVNSDWIKEVFANPESGRSDRGSDASGTYVPADGDDVSDRRLRHEFARKRAALLRRGPTGIDRREPGIALAPIARPPRYRSVARRVKVRLALAVAGLALVWVAVWMRPEPQDTSNPVSARATSPEPAAPINTSEPQPVWLLPEILYGPAMARSPTSRAELFRPAPKTGR
jgi:hypothetical protein